MSLTPYLQMLSGHWIYPWGSATPVQPQPCCLGHGVTADHNQRWDTATPLPLHILRPRQISFSYVPLISYKERAS